MEEYIDNFNSYLIQETDYIESIEDLEGEEYHQESIEEVLDFFVKSNSILDFLMDIRSGKDDVDSLYEEYGTEFIQFRDRLSSADMIDMKEEGERDVSLTWASRLYLQELQSYD